MTLTKECLRCGATFAKTPNVSVATWTTKRRFCSATCGAASRRGRPTVIRGRKFPERSGSNNPRNTRVTLACANCSAAFQAQAYRVAENVRFCQRSCAYAYADQGKTDANERARKSVAYREWRKAVFERDDYTCQECGRRGGELHADHVKPFAFFPELRFDMENGRTLCVPCHKETPTYGVKAWRAAIARPA